MFPENHPATGCVQVSFRFTANSLDCKKSSVRAARKVADDHTVSWDGIRWGVPRKEVCAGLRSAQVEIERRLDGSHWLRFRGRYLRLRHCLAAEPRAVSPSGPTASRTHRHSTRKKFTKVLLQTTHGGHFNMAENRTFLLCVDTQMLRSGIKTHFSFAFCRYSFHRH
jgi:hypothetical protein